MIKENPYVKQFPELMAGKVVLYCHGFASSGQSGTVTRLREVMPQAKVIAPDLPIHPAEAIALLHDICKQEKPALIIGTSMGGMYAEIFVLLILLAVISLYVICHFKELDKFHTAHFSNCLLQQFVCYLIHIYYNNVLWAYGT